VAARPAVIGAAGTTRMVGSVTSLCACAVFDGNIKSAAAMLQRTRNAISPARHTHFGAEDIRACRP
jgi:hypothetical protein